MYRFILLLFITNMLCHVTSGSSHGHHHHAADEDPFHSILEQLGLNATQTQTLNLTHVNNLLARLRLYNCSHAAKHKCVTGGSLFNISKIATDETVGEDDFKKNFAPIIVYALLPHSEESHSHEHMHGKEHMERMITKNISVYDELLKKYQTDSFCESIIDQLLKDVNSTKGDLLDTMTECFSAHNVSDHINVSHTMNMERSHFPEVSVFIIDQLMKNKCIRIQSQSPLPCSTYFAKHLFEDYSKNERASEENIKKLMSDMKISPTTGTQSDSHGHDEHNHRRRRSVETSYGVQESDINVKIRLRRAAESHDDHHHKNESKLYEKCYSADHFFEIYHVEKSFGFKFEEFKKLAPALVLQKATNRCVSDSHGHKSKKEGPSDFEKWGYGLLSVLVVSLCSVAGVMILPVMHRMFYHKVVVFFIALAVGTLTGDALLHLLPHAFGHHDHGHDDHGGDDHSEERENLWKFSCGAIAIYAFFVFETLIHLFVRNRRSYELDQKHSQFCSNMRNVTEVAAESGIYENSAAPQSKGGDLSKLPEKKEKKPIATVAWNIIIGDGLHNIADGIAMGVAFSTSATGGISTSIAIFCHELPHELGDFTILLTAGLSVKMALLANFLSACTCFLGLVVGILIGEIDNANQWIFAFTAGVFIYIALVNMLPELLNNPDYDELPRLSRFILQNLGMLCGFTILFLLSWYEHDINI